MRTHGTRKRNRVADQDEEYKESTVGTNKVKGVFPSQKRIQLDNEDIYGSLSRGDQYQYCLQTLQAADIANGKPPTAHKATRILHNRLALFLEAIYPHHPSDPDIPKPLLLQASVAIVQHLNSKKARSGFMKKLAPLQPSEQLQLYIVSQYISDERRALFARLNVWMRAEKVSSPTYDTWNTHFNELLCLHGGREGVDPSTLGDISVQAAARYCASKQLYGKSRMCLLLHVGFRKTRAILQAGIDRVRADKLRFCEFVDTICTLLDRNKAIRAKGKRTLSDNGLDFKLFQWLEDELHCELPNLDGITVEALTGVLLRAPRHPRAVFRMVSVALMVAKRDEDLRTLSLQLPHKYSQLREFERLERLSPLTKEIAQDALALLMRRSHAKTQFLKKRESMLMCNLARLMNFIHVYALQMYEGCSESEPTNWFLANCTTDMIMDLLIDMIEQFKVSNERVKSSTENRHNSATSVHEYLGFFVTGLKPRLTKCADTVGGIESRIILMNLKNKREPCSSDGRRALEEVEFRAMLDFTMDIRERSLLMMLWFVALRVTALGHVKYGTIVNTVTGDIRQSCKIREKQRQTREFILYDEVLPQMARYCDWFKTQVPAEGIEHRYLFNLEDTTKPYSSHDISILVKRLSQRAHVTGVRVHPHMFRHTLIQRMIASGYTLEQASKIIGHSCSSTTSQYYSDQSLRHIMENPKNPLSNAGIEQGQKVRNMEAKMNQQKENVMKQIANMNMLINSEEGLSQAEMAKLLQGVTESLSAPAASDTSSEISYSSDACNRQY
jgi:integrase